MQVGLGHQTVTIEAKTSEIITITGIDVMTKIPVSFDIPAWGFYRWIRGEKIQDAMPDVSLEAREWLLSGLTDRSFPKPSISAGERKLRR